MTVTACMGAEGNQFVFNSKQNLSSAAAAYNHMTKFVFGPDVVYDAPHNIFMEQKRFIKAGLGAENFRKHVPMIIDESYDFFERNMPQSTGIIDVHDFFSKLIINTASRCLMGKEIRANLDDGPVAKLYYDLDQGFQPINMMFSNLPLPSYRRRDEANEKMTKLYASIIKRRRDENDNSNSDLLQTLMESSYKDGTPLPDDHIAHMMIAVLFGGQHTSATTSTWTILELAARPDIVKELREEIIAKLGSLKADLTYDNLKELTLLESCIRETLRLHPPIFQMMRKVIAEQVVYEKTGHVIPKNHMLCAAPGVTQLDDKYFNNPTKYDPYRWIEKTDPVHAMEVDSDANEDYGFGVVGISSKSPFLPFGAGRHRCIGEQFGYLQLKTIVATFITNYDFDYPEGSAGVPEPDFTSMVVIPKHPCDVRYKRRQ
ncbi:lanosterol 14-alpha demethylase [Umbelopsis sp. PMI_123]|nr:lanosterol 14-alpha demethylase [Umbelopsis sp. PMI_123]